MTYVLFLQAVNSVKRYRLPSATPRTPIIVAKPAPTNLCQYRSHESTLLSSRPLRMPGEALQNPDRSHLLTLPHSPLMAWSLSTSLAVATKSFAGQLSRKIARRVSPYPSFRQMHKMLVIDLQWVRRARCGVWQGDKKAHGWSLRNGLGRSQLAPIKLGEL